MSSWNIRIDSGSGFTDLVDTYAIPRESIERRGATHNGGKSVIDTFSFTIMDADATLVQALYNAKSYEPIPIQVDRDGGRFFTGYIRPVDDYEARAVDIVRTEIEVEAVDRLWELQRPLLSTYRVTSSTSIDTIVRALLTEVGVDAADIVFSNVLTQTVPEYEVEAADDEVLEILDDLLFQFHYCLQATQDGKFDLFNWKDDGSAAVATFDESIESIRASKTDEDYGFVEVQHNRYETIGNDDGTGQVTIHNGIVPPTGQVYTQNTTSVQWNPDINWGIDEDSEILSVSGLRMRLSFSSLTTFSGPSRGSGAFSWVAVDGNNHSLSLVWNGSGGFRYRVNVTLNGSYDLSTDQVSVTLTLDPYLDEDPWDIFGTADWQQSAHKYILNNLQLTLKGTANYRILSQVVRKKTTGIGAQLARREVIKATEVYTTADGEALAEAVLQLRQYGAKEWTIRSATYVQQGAIVDVAPAAWSLNVRGRVRELLDSQRNATDDGLQEYVYTIESMDVATINDVTTLPQQPSIPAFPVPQSEIDDRPTYDDIADGVSDSGPLADLPIPVISGAATTRKASIAIAYDDSLIAGSLRVELQISKDDTDWYALGTGGNGVDDWKSGSLGDHTPIVGTSYTHDHLPLGGDADNPLDTTYYYRARLRTLTKVSDWSQSVSVVVSPARKEDIGAASVTADKIVATAALLEKLLAENATITGELVVGGVGGVLKSINYLAGQAGWKIDADGYAEFQDVIVRNQSADGLWRLRFEGSEVLVEKNVGGTWEVVSRIGGDGYQATYFTTKGIVHPNVNLDALDIGLRAPDGSSVYDFEDSYQDKGGTDPWSTKTNLVFDTRHKLGDKALKHNGADGVLARALYPSLQWGSDLAVAAWFYRAAYAGSMTFLPEITEIQTVANPGQATHFTFERLLSDLSIESAALWIRRIDDIALSAVSHTLPTPTDNYNAVATDGTGRWIAVGNASNWLSFSSDDGASWSNFNKPSSTSGTAVAMSATGVSIIGLFDGGMERASSGTKFVAISTPVSEQIKGIETDDAGTWVAVTGTSSSGKILQSADDGATWTIVQTTNRYLYCPRYQGGTWLVSGDYGQIWRSTDGGANWTQQSYPNTGLLFSLDGDGNGGWEVADFGGTTAYSTDDGVSWTVDSNTKPSPPRSIVHSGHSKFVLVCEDGEIYEKVSVGDTWVSVSLSTGDHRTHAAASGDGVFVIVGVSSLILRSDSHITTGSEDVSYIANLNAADISWTDKIASRLHTTLAGDSSMSAEIPETTESIPDPLTWNEVETLFADVATFDAWAPTEGDSSKQYDFSAPVDFDVNGTIQTIEAVSFAVTNVGDCVSSVKQIDYQITFIAAAGSNAIIYQGSATPACIDSNWEAGPWDTTGLALLGTGPVSADIPDPDVVRITNTYDGNVTDAADVDTGFTVTVTQQGFHPNRMAPVLLDLDDGTNKVEVLQWYPSSLRLRVNGVLGAEIASNDDAWNMLWLYHTGGAGVTLWLNGSSVVDNTALSGATDLDLTFGLDAAWYDVSLDELIVNTQDTLSASLINDYYTGGVPWSEDIDYAKDVLLAAAPDGAIKAKSPIYDQHSALIEGAHGRWRAQDNTTNRNIIYRDGYGQIDVDDGFNWDNATYATKSNRAGKDFYIWECDGSIVLSSGTPGGYTTTRKIGGFHCLCASAGTLYGYVNSVDDIALVDEAYVSHNITGTKHWLYGYVAGDVLPFSLWGLGHRPSSAPEGMVYDPGSNLWVDIYLASWDGSHLVSQDGGTIADGGSTPAFHQYKFSQHFGRQKKLLPRQDEFVSLSLGSPQGVNISGSADPGTTGGHSATNGQRILSLIGVEDATGVIWQWGREGGATNDVGTAWANAYDGNDSNVAGQHYEAPNRPIFSGYWGNGVICGSRGSAWSAPALSLYDSVGARGVAEPYGGRA